ncbi:hypothetical protein K7432_012170 [Basidiobolus ranarum]|uniref:Peptidase M14 domain-containing protein n=1 Tax=Basidiobolus ranarum TaxID=34480 RepID=A0ABR2VSP4_9FUNG
MRNTLSFTLLFLVSSGVFGSPITDLIEKVIRYDDNKLLELTNTPELMSFLNTNELDVWRTTREILHINANSLDMIKLAPFGYRVLVDNLQNVIDKERPTPQSTNSKPNVDDSNWFNEYHPFEDIVDWLKRLQQNYPKLVEFTPSIGQTTSGKDIPAIRITGSNGGKKKKFWLQGVQHAREWIAGSTMQYVAHILASQYASNSLIKNMMDTTEFIIVPIANPDGYSYTWTTDRLWRKNLRDNQDGSFGVDLNRNWSDHWNRGGSSSNSSSNQYMGPNPASEPEFKSLMKYFKDAGPFHGAIDFHSYGELIMYPYAWSQTAPTTAQKYLNLAKSMKPNEEYTASQSSELYVASGSSVDWWDSPQIKQAQGVGCASLVIELESQSPTPGFILPPDRIVPVGKQMIYSVMKFVEGVSNEPF